VGRDGEGGEGFEEGPVVWRPSDGTSARLWYLVVVGCDRQSEARIDRLVAGTEADTVAMRTGIIAALVAHKPCVVHDFDDELDMARHAEATWPGEKIRGVREAIEAERAAANR